MSSSTLPKIMRALTFSAGKAKISEIPLPQLRPSYVLIKTHSVALNPTDWKGIQNGRGGDPFNIVGCDYAGTIVAIGDQVQKPYKVGEKVFGCAHGNNADEPYDGVFAEYAVVKGDLAMKIPENLSFEDASTIGLGSITVGQGLFQQNKGLGLSLPNAGKGNGEWIFIYGGSTATGTLGVQYAKLAGYKVITTCSPRNNDLVKSRGADEIFDYKDPEVGRKIRTLTNNKLRYAWDCYGEVSSATVCADALSTEGGFFGSIESGQIPRNDVKKTFTIMYTVFGEYFHMPGWMEFPASQEDFDFGKSWFDLTEKIVEEGNLKAHPTNIRSGGLDGILDGLEDMKSGKVSGEKLVYRISADVGFED